ncbi:hypothetical protein EXE59_16635 [Nocardioides eburneiflavus]|uniref:Uncharacterized protein n=1 Tax=Nocardioides eburneiflavus TaxID=2518372 RepID=A0A4Z1CL56_9ACTN|nr:hypothetical protein [Nocardioides eburneiflavus]TGN65400.1 hypothetical protein EXE59_16635 [Nocardioides eburneiflavus]
MTETVPITEPAIETTTQWRMLTGPTAELAAIGNAGMREGANILRTVDDTTVGHVVTEAGPGRLDYMWLAQGVRLAITPSYPPASTSEVYLDDTETHDEV